MVLLALVPGGVSGSHLMELTWWCFLLLEGHIVLVLFGWLNALVFALVHASVGEPVWWSISSRDSVIESLLPSFCIETTFSSSLKLLLSDLLVRAT